MQHFSLNYLSEIPLPEGRGYGAHKVPTRRLGMTMQPERELFDELSFYTLAQVDPSFIHQHIVDAYAAQTADKDTKPIVVAFGLIGLYLHIERGYTGKEVQRAHMQLAKHRKTWPAFELPARRGDVRVADVMRAEPGAARDAAIERWMASVWGAWSVSHTSVAELVAGELPYVMQKKSGGTT